MSNLTTFRRDSQARQWRGQGESPGRPLPCSTKGPMMAGGVRPSLSSVARFYSPAHDVHAYSGTELASGSYHVIPMYSGTFPFLPVDQLNDEVPPHTEDRQRGNGRGLPRHRRRPGGIRAGIRHQADPPAAVGGARVRRHVRRRGEDLGAPPPPEHRPGVRVRLPGRRLLHRHGAGRRRGHGLPAAEARAAGRGGAGGVRGGGGTAGVPRARLRARPLPAPTENHTGSSTATSRRPTSWWPGTGR